MDFAAYSVVSYYIEKTYFCYIFGMHDELLRGLIIPAVQQRECI